MSKHRIIPIPFLILILAAVVSLGSILSDRGARASAVSDNSVQVQTIEQERIAGIYFRVMSWLSGISTPRPQPVTVDHPAVPAPRVITGPANPGLPCRIELCAMRLERSLTAKHHHNLN
jgi:hypothetical protein